jgi:hypothetical protein
MKRNLSRWILRFLSDASGANLLEAAVITPLMLLLTLAVVDFASLFYVYLALENGVSQAARYGLTGQQMDGMNHVQSMETVMRQATPGLNIPDAAFTFSHMDIGGSDWIAGDGGPNDLERVQVDYDWSILTPIIRPFFPGGTIHFTVDSVVKNEPPVDPNTP